MQPEDFGSGDLKVENMPTQMLFQQVNHMHRCYLMQLLQKRNLKPGQAGILFVLNRFGEASQRELADRIGVKPPSVTVALQKMEKTGYITRRPDEKDQRIIRIAITDKGKNFIEDIKQTSRQVEELLFKNMSAEEVMLLRRLMLQMRENLMSAKDFDIPDIGKSHHMDCKL